MKVVVQNGAAHGFSRQQVEAMVAFFPRPWTEYITSIVLYQGNGPALQIKHYPKEQTVGVFWPSPAHPQPKPTAAAEELLIAMAIATERGTLPPRISKSLRARAHEQVAKLLAQCIEVLEPHDA